MKLRPSNAVRWVPCPGSFLLESMFPDEETEEAREGTAAHFYGSEYLLNGRQYPVGYVTPNGVPLDADMIEGAQLWIDDVLRVWGERPAASLYVERMVYMHSTIHQLCEGTPDTVLIDFAGRYIHIWDYKYGHRYVEVIRFLQGLLYLAGVVEGIELSPVELASWTIKITVVQPRYYRSADGPVRTWNVDANTVYDEFARLSAAAARTQDPDAPCITGPYCVDCKARANCDALAKAGGVAVEMSGQNLPLTLTPVTLANTLRAYEDAAERLKALITGLQAHAEYEINAGRHIPGYGMEASSNLEKWIVPEADVIAAADLMGVNIRKPAAAMTPNQARKAGLDGGVTAAYSKRFPGARKLVRVDSTSAERAFGNGTNNN